MSNVSSCGIVFKIITCVEEVSKASFIWEWVNVEHLLSLEMDVKGYFPPK